MSTLDNSSPSNKFKIVFLGEQAVGKTAIVTRFIYDNFDITYQATIGLDFLAKTMCLEKNRAVRLQIWDTAGQERFRSLIPSYIRGCSAAVVVYDVTDLDSFKHVDSWINDVKNENGQTTPVFLVGTKTDMPTERQVTVEEGCAKAAEHGIFFIETSSKTSANVRELFYKIAQAMPIIANDGADAGSRIFLRGDTTTAGNKTRHIRQAFCQDLSCGTWSLFSWFSSWFHK